MIATDISLDERVKQLPYEPHDAQKFFIFMYLKADREGRMHAEPELLSKIVAPNCNYSVDEVEDWLEKMESLKKNGYGLIERYEVDGEKYIWFPGFEKNQPLSYRRGEPPSKIPPPPIKKHKTKRKNTNQNESSESNIADEIIDEKLRNLTDYYQSNITIVNPITFDEICRINKEYPHDWLYDAIDEAVKYNKRNLKYIEAILKRWKEEGKSGGTHRKGNRQIPEEYPEPEDL